MELLCNNVRLGSAPLLHSLRVVEYLPGAKWIGEKLKLALMPVEQRPATAQRRRALYNLREGRTFAAARQVVETFCIRKLRPQRVK